MKGRVLSFLLVLGIGFLLMESLTWSAVVSAVGRFFTGLLPGPELLLDGISALVSLSLFPTLLFAMMFKILPDAFIAWRHVGMGALVTRTLHDRQSRHRAIPGEDRSPRPMARHRPLQSFSDGSYHLSSDSTPSGPSTRTSTARQADAAALKVRSDDHNNVAPLDRKPEEAHSGQANLIHAVVKA